MKEETLTIQETRARAMHYAQSCELNNAMTLLAALKSMKIPTRGQDLLRAICFSGMNQDASAIEALREEPRYFLDHEGARSILD